MCLVIRKTTLTRDQKRKKLRKKFRYNQWFEDRDLNFELLAQTSDMYNCVHFDTSSYCRPRKSCDSCFLGRDDHMSICHELPHVCFDIKYHGMSVCRVCGKRRKLYICKCCNQLMFSKSDVHKYYPFESCCKDG